MLATKYLGSDNVGEFFAQSLAVVLVQSGAKSRFNRPGTPWQNGHEESFVSRLRAELLDVELYLNLADAEVKLAVHRCKYNEQRPHRRLATCPLAVAAAILLRSGYAFPASAKCRVIISGGLILRCPHE